MGIAADRDSGIATNLIAGIGQMPTVSAPIERAPTPAVGDLMKAFRDGFITVDDIKKRQTQRPVDESNALLQLQANDFKSKQITQLGPAELALQAHRIALEEKKNEAVEKDLNANEDTRHAREAYTMAKATHEANLVSPDPKVRREAINQQHFFDLEKAYSAATNEPVPESFEVDTPSRVDDFSTWLQKTLPDKVNAAEQKFLQDYPQATPDSILEFREDAKTEALKSAGADYSAYKAKREKQKDVVLQGTPEYYKELQRRLTEGLGKQLTEKAQFEAYKTGLEATAKGTTVKPHPTTVKRLNAAGQEEEVLVLTDPVTGVKTGETVLSTTAPKLTAEQAKEQKFVGIMHESDTVLNQLEAGGFDPTALSTTAQIFLPNRWKSDDVQSYNSARDSWIGAHLRDVSGAAISNPEYKKAAAQFFPEDGDSALEVLRKQARRRAVESEMGRAVPGAAKAAAVIAAPAATDYETLVGKTVTLKDGRTGVVIKNLDGTFSLQ